MSEVLRLSGEHRAHSKERPHRNFSASFGASATSNNAYGENKMEATNPSVFTFLDYECKPLL